MIGVITSVMKVQLKCDKDKLWEMVTDNNNYSWRTDLSNITIEDEKHFTEYAKNGFSTKFEITKKEYLKEYCFNVKNDNLEGHWQGVFKVLKDDLVEFTLREEVMVKKALMRFLARPYLKVQQKRYVSDLKRVLGL